MFIPEEVVHVYVKVRGLPLILGVCTKQLQLSLNCFLAFFVFFNISKESSLSQPVVSRDATLSALRFQMLFYATKIIIKSAFFC